MITIIGSGKVGSTTALFLALKKLDERIALFDIQKNLALGEALDLNHSLSAQGIDVEITGTNDYNEINNSKIVILVAGSGRKSGMSRLDLLSTNSKIITGVVQNITKHSPESILIPVTNPLDPITYITYKVSKFIKNRVIGMGNMLDLARFKNLIHMATNCSSNSISSLVIGEHGENMLPLTRYTTLSGIPLEHVISKNILENIIQKTKEAASYVINLKGATEYAPAIAITSIVESIIKNKRQIIPISAYLDGEYGFRDVTIGVPAVIGKNGIEKIIELDLNQEEKEKLKKAVENIKNAINSLNNN
ncbi:MAG: malate dehydrogenase [Thaumarchaeota archaeon]|nr:malate dehydrogenase [Nitrososphaerota archaeon]MCY3975995.1 malate dehydrogenase [Nitrososphaerota archaeon]